MGTTLATTTQVLAAKVHNAGGAYLDAPVSGGTMGAEAGTLTIMAGGDVTPWIALGLFEVMGAKPRTWAYGQVAKAANQVIVGLTIGAVAEGLSLARKAGIDPAKVREALEEASRTPGCGRTANEWWTRLHLVQRADPTQDGPGRDPGGAPGHGNAGDDAQPETL